MFIRVPKSFEKMLIESIEDEDNEKRNYYEVRSKAWGRGPVCESREEAERWIAEEANGPAKIVVQRLTPKEFAEMDEFQGW